MEDREEAWNANRMETRQRKRREKVSKQVSHGSVFYQVFAVESTEMLPVFSLLFSYVMSASNNGQKKDSYCPHQDSLGKNYNLLF